PRSPERTAPARSFIMRTRGFDQGPCLYRSLTLGRQPENPPRHPTPAFPGIFAPRSPLGVRPRRRGWWGSAEDRPGDRGPGAGAAGGHTEARVDQEVAVSVPFPPIRANQDRHRVQAPITTTPRGRA